MTDNENKQRRIEDRKPGQPLDWSDAQAEQSSTAGAAKGGNTSDEWDIPSERMLFEAAFPEAEEEWSIEADQVAWKVWQKARALAASAPLTDELRMHMVTLRLSQILRQEPVELGDKWAAADALYWLTNDEQYVQIADSIAAAKAAPAAPVQIRSLADEVQFLKNVAADAVPMLSHDWPKTSLLLKAAVEKVAAASVAAPVQAEQAQAEPVAWQGSTEYMSDSVRRSMIAMGGDSKHRAEGFNVPLFAAPVAALPVQAEQAAAVRAALVTISEFPVTDPGNMDAWNMQAIAIRALIAPSTGEAKGDSV